MKLDEGLQRELAQLEEPVPVAHATRYEGLAAFVRTNGPGLVRRARVRRAVLRIGAPAALGLSLVAGAVLSTQSGGDPPATMAKAALPERVPAPPPSRRACEDRAPAAPKDAGTHTELGFLAFSVERRSTVELTVSEPCRTQIHLARGATRVHARDLGGGEMVVSTELGDVVVTGTIFRVAIDREVLVVEVAEGSVAVHNVGEIVARVAAGERLRLEGQSPAIEPLPEDRVRSLRASTEAWSDSRVTTARPLRDEPPPSADLAVEVEAALAARDHDRARMLLRQLGQGTSATAESAWIRLARMELGVSGPRRALDALRERRARFGAGVLGPEAGALEIQARRRAGDVAGAERAARELIAAYPSTSHARRAREWLDAKR